MLDLSGLNPPQREAVLHGTGPLLVLAGAGSGKTRVITYRVAKMVERGVPAKAICAMSFTNKAAEEMRERIAGLVSGRDAEALTMCTFHALGLSILKIEKVALGFPRGFTIYDSADQLGVVREILRSVKMDDRRFDPKAILHRISIAKNAFVSAEEYEGDIADEYDTITQVVYPRYEAALRSFAAVDFDDLIVRTVRLIEENEAVRARWEARFQALLVDEYQDTNRAQLMLMRTLAHHGNVTVVGDDDQSIYAWRGAESSNILDFEKHFPGAQVVKLEQNYRSTPTILAAANAVIKNNKARRDKALWSDGRQGERIVVAVCTDADGESKFVCDEIERLRIEERRRYADVAVLYRSNIQARPLEEGFRNRRIPYEMHGGQKFYERKEVKDIIAYLKVALHPKDEISLRRVVNYPARGIGPVTIEKAAAWAVANKVPMWEALTRCDELGGGEKSRAAIAGFVALIDKTRAALQVPRAAAAVKDLVGEIDLYADLRDAAASLSAAQRRIDNVEELLKSIDRWQEKNPGPEAFGNYLHLLTLNTNDDDHGDGPSDQITMMTLHGAKGLEWPIVFLVGVEEELLPHARTLYPSGPDVEGTADVSEERRLAYVGITRARTRLYLSRARTRVKAGRDRVRTPSRFLEEIPKDLLEPRDLAAEAAKPVEKAELRNFFASFMKEG